MDEKNDSAMPKSNYSMLADNGVLYRAPSQLSSVVARTYKVEYSQRSDYAVGAPIIFDWNTGTSYVDPQTAILSFDLVLTTREAEAAAIRTFTWGGGLGACSLIDEIRIISKNGVEIDRTQDAGLLAKVLADWTLSTEGRANAQMVDGYGTGGGLVVPAAVGPATTGTLTVTVSIPMKLLSGFFRPTVKGMMLPAGLASGLRIEMSLASADRAFRSNADLANGSLSYSVRNPQMLMQLSDFNDPTQSALFTQSAQSGLEYNFPAYFSTKVSNTSTSMNEQLKKAVSQANKCFAVVLPNVAGGGPDTGYSDLHSSGFNSVAASRITAFNWRLGSQFFPLERLTRPTNYWGIANACFNSMRDIEFKPNQVDWTGFLTGGKCIAAACLDMSDRINLSGSKINNSSVLELRIDFANATAVDVVLYLQFTAEVKTSGTRSILKI